ncbi:glycosyltransferase family 39 protein [Candidatus Altiarchaeota archaeon]
MKAEQSSKTPDSTSKFYLAALTAAIFSIVLFASDVLLVGATTFPTANGIWRADEILAHAEGKHGFDATHAIYSDFVLATWRISGIGEYPINVLAKIGLVNALMGGVFVFFLLLSLREFTSNNKAVALIAITYVFGGFFYFSATNSEDIMPAFAFLIAAIFFLIKYLKSQGKTFLAASGVLFGISYLFQKTLLLTYPAFLLSLLYFSVRVKNDYLLRKTPRILSIPLAFLTFSLVPFLLLFLFKGWYTLVVFTPGGAGGWVGFNPYKWGFTLLAGIGQSLAWGRIVSTYEELFLLNNLIVELPTLILVAYLFFRLIETLKSKGWYGAVSSFLIINFVVVESFNLYVQGYDPQFQLPPLLLIPFGLAIVCCSEKRGDEHILKWQKLLALLAVIVLSTTTYTTSTTRLDYDQEQRSYFEKIEHLVDPPNSVFLTHGFDQFPTWGRIVWEISFPEQYICLTCYMVDYPHLDAEETTQRVLIDIRSAQKSGKQVVASDILTYSDDELTDAFSSLDTSDKAVAIKNRVLEEYRLDLMANTSRGLLFRLVEKQDLEELRLRDLVIEDYPQIVGGSTPSYEKVKLLRAWAAQNIDVSNERGLLDKSNSGNPDSLGYNFRSLDTPTIFAYFEEDRGGVWCWGTAYALMRLYEMFGYDSFIVDVGDIDIPVSHVFNLVNVDCDGRNVWSIQDAYVDVTFEHLDGRCMDYLEFLELLQQRRHDEVKITPSSPPLIRDVLYFEENGPIIKKRETISPNQIHISYPEELAKLYQNRGVPNDFRYLYSMIFEINGLSKSESNAFLEKVELYRT